MRHGLTGWRYCAFIGCFVGLIGLHTYFTILSPMMDPEPYRQIREQLEGKISKQETPSISKDER